MHLVYYVPMTDRFLPSQLHVAAANGYTEVMEYLFSQPDVQLDIQDNEGWTPFHAAVCWEQKEAMKMLAEKGANLDVKNLRGETAYGERCGWNVVKVGVNLSLDTRYIVCS